MVEMEENKMAMSIKKARMYKTARFIEKAWDIPEGFTPGEFVSVSYLYKATGVSVFQCTNAAGSIAAISEFELEDFVL